MNFWDIVHPDMKEIVKRRRLSRQKGRKVPKRCEIKLLTKDGKVKLVDFTAMSIEYQDKKVGLGLAIDITEIKKTTEKERFESLLLDAASDSIIAYDLDGNIIYANKATARFSGYTRKELYSMNILDLTTPEFKEKTLKRLSSIKKQKKANFVSKRLTKDGKVIPVEVRAQLAKIDDRDVVISSARDISERLRLEEITGKYQLLSEHAIDIILFIDASTGKILEANEAAVKAYGYSRNELLSKNIRDLQKNKSEFALGENLTHNGTTFESEHVRKDGSTFPVEINLRTASVGDETIAIAIVRDITERKKTEKALKESKNKLQKMLTSTIDSLVTLIEKRDAYTAGHHRRVAKLATAIAREMGLPEDLIESIRIAAILHDIGKIYIPTEILSKPSRLADAEFEIVKAHTKFGHDILKLIEFPWPVAEIVLQHHERINSSGYPRGLKNEDIRLEAKIIAVADVVEAMSSHRPYRPALGVEEALREIEKNKGILYDPEVVDACLRLFRKKNFHLTLPPNSSLSHGIF